MKRILFIILTISLFSLEIFANDKINLVLKDIQSLKSTMIESEIVSKKFTLEKTLNFFLENTEGTLYESTKVLNTNLDSILAIYLSEKSLYPLFCNELVISEDINLCSMKIKSLLNPIKDKLNYVYLNGDYKTDDFKTLFLVYEAANGTKLAIKLAIQDERDLSE